MYIPLGLRTMPRSGIREVMALALERPGTIRLELGEPDFPTAPHVVEAAARAARSGRTKYSVTAGVPALREALAEKVRRRNGFTVDAADVVVTNGAVQGLYASLVGLLEPGAGVLIPSPGWPNYLMMCRLLRAVPQRYPLRAEAGYLPRVEDLEALVDHNTRVLLLNSPANPLGAVIDRERMREILEFAARHDLWVVSDECYDELTYDAEHVSAAQVADDDRVITAFSFSKTYAMTGWRIGYVTLPSAVTSTVTNVHEATMSCVATPTQYAALEAVTGPQDVVTHMRDTYRRRRDAALTALEAAGVSAFRPEGAFYIWIDVSASGLDSRDFSQRLVVDEGVAMAPGTAFGPGAGRYVRMSVAAHQDDVLEGVRRLGSLVESAGKGSCSGATDRLAGTSAR